MALEVYDYEGLGPTGNRLDDCPFCGYEFNLQEERPDHYVEEHGPEDAGLSPIGKRPEGVYDPLFTPVEEIPGGGEDGA